MEQNEEKASLRGPFVPQDKLKPAKSTQFTSAPFEALDELKHRPPEEKDFSLSGTELLNPVGGGADRRGGEIILSEGLV
jgi:hypothetical protein